MDEVWFGMTFANELKSSFDKEDDVIKAKNSFFRNENEFRSKERSLGEE